MARDGAVADYLAKLAAQDPDRFGLTVCDLDGAEHRVLTALQARRLNAIMLTSGTYDAAGEFAYEVGFPCKSGVAGAIMGVVPHRMGVAVWSPPLDPFGNSRAGREALNLLADRLDLSVF